MMHTSESEVGTRDALLDLLGLAYEPSQGRGGNVPFSFTLGGETVRHVADGWRREVSEAEGERHRVNWSHGPTGICVTADVLRFANCPAIDYVLHITNEGGADSPVLESVLPLDVVCELPGGGPVTVHYAKGSSCTEDDFLPLHRVLYHNNAFSLSPVGGRSSNGTLPFFNMTWPGGGLLAAVGWTGQWQATFGRDKEGNLLLAAGMQKTRIRLHPGETIRTPRIVLLCWEGEDRLHGHNMFRNLMIRRYLPRVNGEVALPPTTHNNASTLVKAKEPATEENQLAVIGTCASLGLECYWLDAYWFPQPWWTNVGNWTHREEDFPRGLAPLGEAAHKAGLGFILWFEPERVYRDTAIHREHPDFLLAHGTDDMFLFNLGNPEALKYMTDLISDRIDMLGIDVYRQDFNMNPLPYWQANDSPDRTGMAEIRHIEGLYTLWGEIRRRHPNITIDNCASGGRRIDLETCSLSYPLWRSDFPDAADRSVEYRRVLDPANQVEHAGLSLYIPLHAGPVSDHDAYSFRSAMSTGVCLYSDVASADFPADLARQGIAEIRELRPLMLGDFYPLTPITVDPSQWFAYQYNRPDLGTGCALYFRRKQCRTPTICAGLRAIDPEALYAVSTSDTFDTPPSREMTGAELASLAVFAELAPAAVLLRYERVKSDLGGYQPSPC